MTTLSLSGSTLRLRSRRCTRLIVATLAAIGFAALAWASFVSPLPRFIYNPSDSVAVGWYRVDPHTRDSVAPPVGSLVLVPLPADAAALAARRGYLPLGVPLLKPVAAVAPEQVCVVGRTVRIDGVPVATILSADTMGRPLLSWQHCRRLRPGELFLLSTRNPASFDSRYFGPVATSSVIGAAHPVWLETRR